MSFRFKKLLTALLYFSLITNVQAETGQTKNQLESVKVEITTHLGDAQTFVEGDQISFMLSLDKAAYVYLFYEDAEGRVLQLVPNNQQISNFYQPGLFVPIPDQKADFKFIVQAPFGKDKLWVFALDRNVTEFPGQKLANGLKLVDQSIAQLTKIIKGQALKQFGTSYLLIITEGNSTTMH